ncbi:beta-lactamase family protein [Flexivirga sp. ID2601S]|uniref:Beta-lactamase family protein n=1 Tax=Flexivirga aerilata TaxID=1656889 RepID=A0A849AL39_9MICO|nr:serine hydrolase domain-containing protein [Flexivirga aerilata]NNG40051.1 beta-lactamase family protein [Flexivirga aerilata]
MQFDDATTRLLDARLAAAQRASRAPSVVAGVIADGALAWTGAAGRIDGRPDGETASAATQYRIGSITKTFTAVLTLRLVQDGLVGLTDPIGEHLPELAGALPGVRVSELLTHGAGLPAETDGDWWERSAGRTWEQLVPSIRLIHRPGRRFHYSNSGFAVLGELASRLRGVSWSELVQSQITGPLGMTDTSYGPGTTAAPGLAVHPYADLLHEEPATDTLAMAPAGQLWSTIGDLARFALFLARGNPAVLDDGLRREMQIPTLVNDEPGENWSRAYGFGLDIVNRDGTRYVGHGGSMPGHQAALRIDPETGDGAVLLVNNTAGIGLDAIGLLQLARQHQPRTGTPWTASPAPDPAAANALTGTWFWGPRPHTLTVAGDGTLRLAPERGNGRGSTFAPAGDGDWIGLDEYFAGERLTALPSPQDPTHLDVAGFRFSRTPYDPGADIPGGTGQGWR